MITLENFAEVPARVRGAFLAVGNFDGVHRGHTQLLGRLRARADGAGAMAVALTFDPHPVALLRPESAPSALVWTGRKVELLEAAGANEVGVFRTGPWLLGLSAREFFDRVIIGQFGARGMVEGPNFGFGRDRGGTRPSWPPGAPRPGSSSRPPPPPWSTTNSSPRRASAASWPKDPPPRPRGCSGARIASGGSSRGAGRGAGLGFPTANLDRIEVLIPADGVYAARAYLPGASSPLAAACHVGANATFGEQARNVEAHLIGFEGDLYGQEVELDFLDRLRPSRRFDGPEELLAQVRLDVERAAAVCSLDEVTPPSPPRVY